MKKFVALCFVALALLSDSTYAKGGLKLGPAMARPSAKLEKGWNFLIAAGAATGYGYHRNTGIFLDPGLWRKGFIFSPEFTFGAEYAFSEDFALQVKLPLIVFTGAIDVYGQLHPNFGIGAELGLLPALYAVASIYPTEDSAITYTPRVIFPFWGSTYHVAGHPTSRVILENQLALTIHSDPIDFGPYVSYSYAPGNGTDLISSGLFSDDLYRHFGAAGFYFKF